MTLVLPQRRSCGHCRQAFESPQLLSWSDDGARPTSLDLRPPSWHAELGATRCPHCGYCAFDVEAPASAAAAAAMRDDAYRRLADDTSSSPVARLARRYLAVACLAERDRRVADAARAQLCVAWIWDDVADAARPWPRPVPPPLGDSPSLKGDAVALAAALEEARQARGAAAARWAAALAAGQPPIGATTLGRDESPLDALAASTLVQVDVLRRGGDAAGATALARDLLAQTSPTGWDDLAGDVLRLQLELATRGNEEPSSLEAARTAVAGWQDRQRRRAKREADRRAEAAQAAARARARTVPRFAVEPLRAALAEAAAYGARPPDAALLARLPLPEGIAADVARYGERLAWPALAALGALGVALRRVVPELPDWTGDDDRRCGEACVAHADLADFLAHALRRCSVDQWHWWPPAGPDDGPQPPDYRSGAAGAAPLPGA